MAADTITFGASGIQNNSTTNALIINATILTAAVPLLDASAGTVILTASNGFTSGINIEGGGTAAGGTLQIGVTGTAGSTGGGAISFVQASGQTAASTLYLNNVMGNTVGNSLNIAAGNGVGGIIQVGGTGTVVFSNAGGITLNSGSGALTFYIGQTGQAVDAQVTGPISGIGSVIKTGAGTLSFTGSNNYSGATTLSAGTLLLVANSGNTTASGTSYALGNGTTALTLGGGTTLALQGNSNNTIFKPSTIVEVANSNPNFNAFNFSAGDTDNGTTTGKTLILANFGEFGSGSTTPIFNFAVNNNFTLQIGSGVAGTGNLNIYNPTAINSTVAGGTLSIAGIFDNFANNYPLYFGGAGNISSGAIIPNNGTYSFSVTEEGPGTTTLTGVNTYFGATTVYAGTLAFTGLNTGVTALTVNGGTLNDDYTGSVTGNILASGDVLTLGGAGGIFEVNGATTSAANSQTLASLTLTGAGTIQMINNNSGATTTGLTFSSSTITRSTGGSVDFVEPASATSIVLSGGGTTTAGSILAPYAFFTGGANVETYAALTSGTVGAASLASDAAGSGGANNFTSATTSYAYTSPGATDILTASASAFAADFNTSGAQTISLGSSNYNLSINGILNTGGALTIQNGSGGTGSVVIPTTSGGNTELLISGNSNVTISAPITGASGILSDDDTGTLTLSGSNTYTGASNFNAGTTSLTGYITGGGAITVGYGATFTEAGGATIGGGTTFTTGGTTTLAGINNYTGTTNVNAGTLTISGSLGATTTAGQINVGLSGGPNATLNIQPGSVVILSNTAAAENTTNSSMEIGAGETSSVGQGFVYQSGGAVSGIGQLTLGSNTLGALSSYGYYNLSGGTLSVHELDDGGFDGSDTGVFDMSGGTMTVNNWFILGRGGLGSSGIFNMTGGTVNFNAGNSFEWNWGGNGTGNQTSILNIANASFISANGATANLMQSGVSTNLGEINLLSGGLLQINGVAPNSATGASLVNFNGGTLKAYSANTTFLTTNLTGAYVYSGSGTINNNGVAITIPVGLLAPTGNGVNSNPAVTSGGSGYLGAPMVTFSGGGGVGASGYATVSGGVITGIVITDPGTGYTSAPSILLTGGGGSGAAIGPISISADTSGGMTFAGSSTTTLSGVSTYTGPTTISAGTLTIGSAGQLGAGSYSGNISNAGTFTYNSSALQTLSGAISGAGAFTDSGAGTLTLSGSNSYSGVTTLSAGTLVLVANSGNTNGSNVSSALSNSSTELVLSANTTLALQGNTTGAIFEPANSGGNTSLTTGIVEPTLSSGPFNFTAGDNNSGVTTGQTLILGNFGELGAGNTTPTFNFAANNGYTLQIGSGTAGTGALLIYNNTAINSTFAGGALSIPGGIAINYNATYTGTFGGVGNISVGPLTIPTGNMNVTYNGTGTLSLIGANTYTGTTTVTSGTVQVGNGTAGSLANGSALSVSGGATLAFDEANAGSQTQNIADAGTVAGVEGSGIANTLSGIISGAGGFRQSGAGTTILSGDDTYTGATNVNAGTLSLTGGIGSGGGSAIINSATFTESTAGAITGTSSFSNTAGTATLAGVNNNYSGATNVSGGTLNLTGTYSGTGATTVSGAGTLNVTGSTSSASDTYAINGGGTLGNTNVINGAFTAGYIKGAVTVAGGTNAATQGSISLLNNSGGTLTLGSGLTLGSTTSGSNSILNFAEGGLNPNLLQLGTGTLTVNAGGAVINISTLGIAANQTYSLIDFGTGAGAGFGAGTGSTVDGLSLGTLPSIFGVSGYSLNVSSTSVQLTTTGQAAPSTAYWSGTFGSVWNANNGTIGNFTTDSAGANFVGALPAATTNVIFSGSNASNFTNTLGQSFTINSLTFTGSNGSNAVTIAADGSILTVGTGGVLVQSGAGPVTLGVNLAGAGSVTANSTSLALLGTNSYTGNTNINSGTVQINSSSSLGTSGTVAMANGATLEALNAATSANNFTLSGNSTIQTDSGVYQLSGVVASSGTLVKTGPGTLTLANTNTYTGGTVINNGTVSIGANLNLGASTDTVLLNGGTLAMTAGITNTHAFTIGANGGTIDIGTGGQYFFNTANTLLGSGTLTVIGSSGTLAGQEPSAGNLRIAQTNTYSGNVILQSGGIFEYGVNGAVASSGTFTINTQGELAVNAGVTLPNAITLTGGTSSVLSFENGATGIFSGPITLASNATVGLRDWYAYQTSASGVISGVISGNGFGITTNPGTSTGGVVTLTASNTYTGATVIAANTSVQLGNGGATGALSTSSAITDNGTLIIDRGNAVTQGTDFSGAGLAGAGGFTQAGTGTTTLNGSNSYAGTTAVSAGTLNYTGTLTGGGSVTVGNTAATKATLNIQAGSSVTAASLLVGNNATATGAVYQTGGTLTLTNAAGANDISIGNVASGYGYYSLSGGTVAANEIDVGGLFNATTGVMDMSGGTLNDAGWITVGRGGTTSSGVLNITGGTVNLSAATGNIGMYWGGAGGQAIVNIGGGAGAATVTQSTTTGYALVMSEANVTGTSEVNLLTNGKLQIGAVTDGNANTTALLDFNGGTLKANLANATYLTSTNMSVFVYGNGGTIDNNGVAITIGDPLKAPNGSGANGNPTVTSGGSGYIGVPMVTATGAGGTGATAYATVSGGVITGIVVTNPGTGYTGPLGFVLTGGGGTGATIGTVTPTADTSGGMTFQGSGTTTLAGANTYTGATAVTAGTLSLTGTLTGSSVTTSGAGILTESSGGLIAGSGVTFTQGSTGTSILSGANTYTGSTAVNAGTLNLTGTLTASSVTTSGVGIFTESSTGVISDASASFTQGSTGTSILSGANTYTGPTNVNSGTLQAGVASVSGVSGAFGTDSAITMGNIAGATLALNGFNTEIGSLAGGGSTGGSVTLGSATLTDVTASSTSYAGNISGAGGFTVNGSGTQTLTGSNGYTGTTTIGGNATLQLGNGTSGNDGTIEGSSSINDNGTLIYNRSGNLTTNVPINGSGNVVMTGSGTETLAATNGYGGTTTVDQGTLIVSGELSGNGAVTVNSGATLGAATGVAGAGGIIDGPVTIAQGGTIAPGAQQTFAGTVLTINNNLTLSGTANLAINLDGGNNSDYLSISGALSIDPTDTLTLNILNPGSNTPETLTYVIALYGSETGQFNPADIVVNGPATFDSINYDDPNAYPGGNDISITLTLAAVPEPGTLGMLLSGTGMLIAIQRMRRRKFKIHGTL